jgi:adenylate kinase family enzyme
MKAAVTRRNAWPVRIAVIGSTGSGKTTLGKALAGQLALPFVELDALHWDPRWTALTETDPDAFVRRVDAATAAPGWVCDGNYKLVRHLVWGRATHLVWLDYARPVIMARVIRRTLSRSLRGTELWSGNREQWRNLLRADHPVWWAWRHFSRHRREWAAALADPAYGHLAVRRVRQPATVAEVLWWLDCVRGTPG